MKALVLSALVAGVLSLSGPARALPTQSVFDVQILDGPDTSDGTDLGLLIFDLDADTGRACRYYMEWSSNLDDSALSLSCYVDEAKTHGHASCFANSDVAFPTLLTNVRGLPCAGFDGSGMMARVFLLSAVETDVAGHFEGVIQFTAASAALDAIDAEPYP